jgi:ACS family hexuronate transporter-like MFS transporter
MARSSFTPRPFRGVRWTICGLLFLVTTINYIDRVSLGAMKDAVLAPAFGWGEAEFGWILFWFHVAYGLMFGLAGRLIDRVGVRTGLALGAVVWSLAAASHALASSVVGFALARFLLGLGEATNFPAAIKAVAEWFPRRERALATGIFNMGTNVGAMLQGPILLLATGAGWQAAFLLFGGLGLLWTAAWLRFYRSPRMHPRLSREEAALILGDQEPAVEALAIPWPSLLRYRAAWAFCLGKMLTDPVWWFYLYYLMPYLKKTYPSDLKTTAGGLMVVYVCADLGSLVGGWLPGRLERAGWSASRARLTTLALFAGAMPVMFLLDHVTRSWAAVALLSVANGAHQGWSANLFTVASDAFPQKAVGSVVGFGAMAGGIGGMFMPLVAGAVLTLGHGRYAPLFWICGALHPLTWIAMRVLAGPQLRPIDLDRGLRTAFSPALLAGGLGVAAGGAALACATWRYWAAIVAATPDRSSSTAAFGLAGGAIAILMGLALVYASREQRPARPVRA